MFKKLFRKIAYFKYRLQFNYPQFFNHRPIHLDLEINRSCNLQCSFCYRQNEGFEKKFPIKAMSFAMAENILVGAYNAGLRSVKFNWRGEPTLSPILGELCGIAYHLGYLDIMINTNGVKLPDDLALEYLTEIRVSLDTMKRDVYEKSRMPAKLETVIKNLAELIQKFDIKNKRLYIQRRTTDEMESDDVFLSMLFLELFEKLDNQTFGKNPIIVLKDLFEADLSDDLGLKLKYFNSKPVQPRVAGADVKSYYASWQEGKLNRRWCKQPSQRLVVDVDGNVHACCLNYDNGDYLNLWQGGIKDKEFGFERVIECYDRGRIIEDLRRGFYKQDCLKCTSFSAYERIK